MRIIGIDCANKSLAVSIIDFNSNWKGLLQDINERYNNLWEKNNDLSILQNHLDEINNLVHNLFELKYVDVFDLIPGKSLKETKPELRKN